MLPPSLPGTRPPRRSLLAGLLAATLAATAAPAVAQPVLAGELALGSSWVWRGVTTTNRPVLQPTLTLTLPVGPAALTMGAWGNVEPARYDGARDITSLGAAGTRPGPHPFVTQSQLWVETGRTRGRTALTAGLATSLYPHMGGLDTDFNTAELYGTVALDVPFAPRLSLWQDLRAVHGSYAELAIGHERPLVGRGRPVGTLAVELLAGVAGGEAAHDGDAPAYFAHDGLTHLEGSATATLAVGAARVAPTVHLVYGRDPWTRVTAPDRHQRLKLRVGATVGWERALGRAGRVAGSR